MTPDCSRTVTTIAWSLAGIAGFGFLGGRRVRQGWVFELASHFRLQYVWILFASAALWLLMRQWVFAGLAAGLALIALARLIIPVRPRRAPPPQGPISRVLLANVLSSNRSYELMWRAIRESQPDLIVLEEVTTAWLTALQALQSDYPFSQVAFYTRRFGILLASRLPVEHVEARRIGGVGLPSLIARVRIGARCVTVIATHLLSPKTPRQTKLRDQQFLMIAQFVRQQPGPVMVLGDLNMTPWSPAFQEFLRATHLQDSRVGFGLQPSWPVCIPFARIPIDHGLVSSEIIVHKRQLGPKVGSDHYPVIIEFSVHEGASAA